MPLSLNAAATSAAYRVSSSDMMLQHAAAMLLFDDGRAAVDGGHDRVPLIWRDMQAPRTPRALMQERRAMISLRACQAGRLPWLAEDVRCFIYSHMRA